MKKNRFPLSIILVAFLIVLSSLSKRIIMEKNNLNYEILIQNNDESFRKSSIVIEEFSLDEWMEKSWVSRWQPGLYYPFNDRKVNTVTLIFDKKKLFEQARNSMELKIPSRILAIEKSGTYFLRIEGIGYNELKDMGMGISDNSYPDKNIYLRPINDKWITLDYIRWLFSVIKINGVIFKGKEVIGYPDLINEVNGILRTNSIFTCNIEFADQHGFKTVSASLDIIRLHSMGDDIKGEKGEHRAIRAVLERNIRILYFKDYNEKLIMKIEKKLAEHNFNIGLPNFFKEKIHIHTSLVSLFFCCVGLSIILRKKKILLFIFLCVPAGFFYPSGVFHVLLITCAVLFPVSAVNHVMNNENNFFVNYSIFFVSSIFAGLFIGAVACDPVFLTKYDTLHGIKIALILPIFISYFIVYRENNTLELLTKPVRWIEIIAGSVIISIVAVYIFRSSNNNFGLFTSMEEKFRILLENIFVVRPRFKEFLIGHPLMIVGLYLMHFSKDNKYYRFLILFGLVGQVSIINTFMHIHSPIYISLLRTFIGIILGSLFGVCLIGLLKLWPKIQNK